jgi:hypothetical protein
MPLNEGQTVQYTVTTTRVADGTVLYWKTTGNTTNSDIVGGNTGSVTITNNQGVFNVTTSADVNTDGPKTLGISLSTGSQSGPTVVSTANPIVVEDTSRAPVFALYGWGFNSFGNIGTNDTDARSSPTQVGGVIWSSISSSLYHTTAIQTNGTLWSWGINGEGQLGQNDGISKSSPTQVGGTDWSKVSVGGQSTAAIKTNGTLWTWGTNSTGDLGLNDRVNRSNPTQIGSDTNWSLVSFGSYKVCGAVKTNGTLWSWGKNQFGQLGHNNRVYRSSPTQVGSDTTWSKISTHPYGILAIKTNGTLWAWGVNSAGILGINISGNYRSSPVQVGSNTNWSSIFCQGSAGVMAIKTDGTLWSWGQNGRGQLGHNDRVYRSSPTQVGSDTNWAQIGGGDSHFIVRKTNGTIYSVGGTGVGGHNDRVYRSTLTQIGSQTNWGFVGDGSGSASAFAITSS